MPLSAAEEILSKVLGLDRTDLHNSLNDGTLGSSGIVRLNRAGSDLSDMLSLLDGMDTHLL